MAVIDSGRVGDKIKVTSGTTGSSVFIIPANSCSCSTILILTVCVTWGAIVGNRGLEKIAVAGNGIKTLSQPRSSQRYHRVWHGKDIQICNNSFGRKRKCVGCDGRHKYPVTNFVKINMSKYAGGVYLVKITDMENGQRAIKFVEGE